MKYDIDNHCFIEDDKDPDDAPGWAVACIVVLLAILTSPLWMSVL